MKISSLISHVCEVLSTILATFEGETARRAPPPDALIAAFFRSRKYLGSHDRRFIAETVYGTIRHLRRVDHILDTAIEHPRKPRPLTDPLPRVLAYLIYVDDARSTERSHELLVTYGEYTQLFPQQVDPEASLHGGDLVQVLSDRHSFQPWMIREFVNRFGPEEAAELVEALNAQAPLAIRTNTLKCDRDRLQDLLQARGIESEQTSLSPFGLVLKRRVNVFGIDAFRQGLFEVQDEGSQLLPLIVDPKPTSKVLDACAGAGGKALELSALMKNRGEVVATDVSARRLQELRKRAKRAGAHNIRVRQADYTVQIPETSQKDFDVVLLDAPCSGTGTIRRNPGLKWTVTESVVSELVEKQVLLLRTTSRLVKPGGVVWYCTCSLLPRENEGVLERFLSEESSFSLQDPSKIVDRLGLPNVGSGSAIHLLPHRHGTDGFFCAALERMT